MRIRIHRSPKHNTANQRRLYAKFIMLTMIIFNTIWFLQKFQFKSVESLYPYYYQAPTSVVDGLNNNNNNNPSSSSSSSVDVFYHLFLKDDSDRDRVSRIVRDQFRFLIPGLHRNIFVTNIGRELPGVTSILLSDDASSKINITILNHMTSGAELVTLHEVWSHCQRFPDSLVVYLHSKGSFHDNQDNVKFRQAATMSALSEECSKKLPTTCDVCAMRMSPFPHAHTPGNMFSARCSYVRNLLDPASFDKVMGEEDSTYYGTGRYAAEHWVLSHPSARPCDVFSGATYIYGYNDIPTLEELSQKFSLATAPRFPLHTTVLASKRSRRIQKHYPSFEERMDEYKRLYGQTPNDDWWGWDFFERKGSISDAFPPKLFRPSS